MEDKTQLVYIVYIMAAESFVRAKSQGIISHGIELIFP